MISTQMIRRYPIFVGLSGDQVSALAKVAREVKIKPGHCFFHENETLKQLFFVIDGQVDIAISIPDRNKKQALAEQLLGNYVGRDVVVSTVGPGQLFAWSAMIPPYVSTANAKATSSCQVVAFGREDLLKLFDEDRHLGYLMFQKIAAVIRQRLRETRIQSLAPVLA